MKKIVFAVIGVLFILIGVAGLLLPVLPGWALIFVGLSFVAPRLAESIKRKIFLKFFKNPTVPLGEWRRLGVDAGFSTRHFPLVLKETDDLLAVENQEKLRMLLGHEGSFAFLNQVHGGRVAVLKDAAAYSAGFHHLEATDGVLASVPGLTLLVLSADCLPIFFTVVRKGAAPWIGLVHAGWRGTRQGIAAGAFKTLLKESGARPEDVHLAFGPCIRADRYEVGPEFLDYFPPHSLRKKRGKIHFDLAGENKRQLLEAGAREDNLVDPGICTVRKNAHFYSFRAEKDSAGRIVSFIRLKATAATSGKV